MRVEVVAARLNDGVRVSDDDEAGDDDDDDDDDEVDVDVDDFTALKDGRRIRRLTNSYLDPHHITRMLSFRQHKIGKCKPYVSILFVCLDNIDCLHVSLTLFIYYYLMSERNLFYLQYCR